MDWGGFGASVPTDLTAGDAAADLAAGNLVAGDGTDLAVAARNADVVRVLLNALEGTLTVSASIDVSGLGSNPVGVAAGDVDGSGLDDLAIALQGEALIAGQSGVAVSIDGGAPMLLTAPAGGFGSMEAVELCDLDGDGDLDLIATVAGTIFAASASDVLLYEGDGLGGFAAPIALTTAEDPRALCCGDLDGDGDLDIAVTTQALVTPGAAELFMNDGLTAGAWGAGSFSSGGTYAGGDVPYAIACGDLDDENIDGFYYRNDVVVANLGSGDLTRHDGFADAGAGFEATTTLPAGTVPFALAIADLNGDKTPDIVVADKTDANLVVILANPQSQARAFGVGCAGIGGLVPSMSTVNLPVAGSTDFTLELSQARPFSIAAMGYSLNLTPVVIGGCDLYVSYQTYLGLFPTDFQDEASVPVGLPAAEANLFVCDVFAQWVVFDPAGTMGGVYAFSEGLRIKIAN